MKALKFSFSLSLSQLMIIGSKFLNCTHNQYLLSKYIVKNEFFGQSVGILRGKVAIFEGIEEENWTLQLEIVLK